ncbi:hypothetical protein TKK_0015611 [Trichogramma kaykai]
MLYLWRNCVAALEFSVASEVLRRDEAIRDLLGRMRTGQIRCTATLARIFQGISETNNQEFGPGIDREDEAAGE